MYLSESKMSKPPVSVIIFKYITMSGSLNLISTEVSVGKNRIDEFTKDSDFPFFIQYGRHEEDLCIHSHKDFSELTIVLSGDVVTWIEENFRQEISVKELSRRAGYSERHFLRIFKETYHMTPTEYINTIRIEYVCSRLRQTKESVTDIAYDCGFRNMSYFYRIFSKKMNITPKRYRDYL